MSGDRHDDDRDGDADGREQRRGCDGVLDVAPRRREATLGEDEDEGGIPQHSRDRGVVELDAEAGVAEGEADAEVDEQRRQAGAHRQAHGRDRDEQDDRADEQHARQVVEVHSRRRDGRERDHGQLLTCAAHETTRPTRPARRSTRKVVDSATMSCRARTAASGCPGGVLRSVRATVETSSSGPDHRRRPARHGGRRGRGARRLDRAAELPADRWRARDRGPDEQGVGAARRPRHPDDLCRQRERPLPGAGLRQRSGPLLRDGPAPPPHRRTAVRDGRRGRPRVRQGRAHDGLAPGRRAGAAAARPRDPAVPPGLRRRRQRLHRVRSSRPRRCRSSTPSSSAATRATASSRGRPSTPSPGSRRSPGTCAATTTTS